jgi:hypothetical protein
MSILVTELPAICTKSEIAAYFRVSVKSIDCWRKTKGFPQPLPATRRRWCREAILAWVRGAQEGGDHAA